MVSFLNCCSVFDLDLYQEIKNNQFLQIEGQLVIGMGFFSLKFFFLVFLEIASGTWQALFDHIEIWRPMLLPKYPKKEVCRSKVAPTLPIR